MTQLAATGISTGSKIAGHGGKASGVRSAGADFASFANAAGLPTDADATADADAATPFSEDVGTEGSDSDKGKDGRKGDDALTVDLSLNAAAQSAVADPVVAQPPILTPTVPPQTVASSPAKTDDITAAAAVRTPRASWRAATEATTNTPAPVAKDAATQALPAASPTAANPGAARTMTAQQAVVPSDAAPSNAAPLPVNAQTAVEQTAVQDAATQQAQPTVAQADAAPIDLPPVSLPTANAKYPVAKPARTETTGTSTQQTDSAPESVADKPSVPPIFAALPQAVLNPKAQSAALPVATPAPAPAPQVAKDATDPATTAAAALAVTDSPAAPVAVGARPVMSALHRAVPAHGDAASQAVATADAGRSGSNPQQDGGKDSDSGATTLNQDSGFASSVDASASSSQPFSDILQSLPPLAQSRIGLVANDTPVVTGPADVGATLQGQVIDMGVGGQWIDRMAKEITTLAAGTGHSRFQLNPPNLGKIQIDVWHGENGGEVKLVTETDEAAQRLRAGKSGLEADARMSALSLHSITIEKSAGAFGGNADQGSPQQQAPQQQRHQSADQSFGQQGAQSGAQSDGQGNRGANQPAMLNNAQTGSQGNSQGRENNGGQGKGPFNRDVLKDSAGTAGQDGGSLRRDGDRIVRYA